MAILVFWGKVRSSARGLKSHSNEHMPIIIYIIYHFIFTAIAIAVSAPTLRSVTFIMLFSVDFHGLLICRCYKLLLDFSISLDR